MAIAFPAESPEYRAARNRLLGQEIELRRAMEAVAAARRELRAHRDLRRRTRMAAPAPFVLGRDHL